MNNLSKYNNSARCLCASVDQSYLGWLDNQKNVALTGGGAQQIYVSKIHAFILKSVLVTSYCIQYAFFFLVQRMGHGLYKILLFMGNDAYLYIEYGWMVII